MARKAGGPLLIALLLFVVVTSLIGIHDLSGGVLTILFSWVYLFLFLFAAPPITQWYINQWPLYFANKPVVPLTWSELVEYIRHEAHPVKMPPV